jgi:tetratricopeptide (TPR) repeat protein
MLYTYFDAREFNLRQADIASQKALELEPELAESHVARGLAVSLSKRFDEAEREFETAMRLDPKSFEATYWFGRARLSQGRYEEAARLFDRASLLRPEDYQAAGMLAQAYAALGRKAESEDGYRRQIRLVEQQLELTPDDARACIFAAIAHSVLREVDKSLEYAERGMSIDPDDPMLLYNVACVYAQLDKREDALACLERAVDKGFGHKEWIEHDPDLSSIRDSARFRAITQAM